MDDGSTKPGTVSPSTDEQSAESRRSAEETAVAHDLLELSRSLPPLYVPELVSSVQDIKQEKVWEGESSPSSQETSSPPVIHFYNSYPSECSSDAENHNPNNSEKASSEDSTSNSHAYSECSNSRKEPRERSSIKDSILPTVYTYDASHVVDGRSKRSYAAKVSDEPVESKMGKFKCSDCGKQYATSSNLSRHKQVSVKVCRRNRARDEVFHLLLQKIIPNLSS